MHENAVQWRRLRHAAELKPLLDLARERLLLDAALHGDAKAATEIIECHMRLVIKIAARYQRRGLAAEDLVSEGVLGLMEALRRYDPTQNARFAGYATWWIRARVSQFALANRRAVAMPSTRNARSVARWLHRAEHRLSQTLLRPPTTEELAAELGVSPNDVGQVRAALSVPDLSLEQPSAGTPLQMRGELESPEDAVSRAEVERQRKQHIGRALGGLSAREREIVQEQYLCEDGHSLSELGERFGVSRQRLGQVLSSAREKLRAELIQVA